MSSSVIASFSAPIGVFDSGIGGLSILRALRKQLPHEDFVYFADTAHNPYGGKSTEFVTERSLAIADELVSQHRIKALVVACNTATAVAIQALRERYPDLPLIGIEPAIKPATQLTKTGRVLVLATHGTLKSEKFAALLETYRKDAMFTCVACVGLAEMIEHIEEQVVTPDLIAFCAGFMPASDQFGIKKGQIDTLVLGCTHYPLIAPVWRELVGPQVVVVDNAQAVALQTMRLLKQPLRRDGDGTLSWRSSADSAHLAHVANFWLSQPV
ncbi:MAG: glutamate racemase [Brachymonas sp.]|nr:glutamate racemase [Brachymonas sp.]